MTLAQLPAEPAPGVVCSSLPEHRFLHCLSRSSHVEVWRVEQADGRQQLARFVHGFRDAEAQAQWEALMRATGETHPGLLRCDSVLSETGRVVLLTEVIDLTLWDRFEQCRRQRLPGVPRWELLTQLLPVADALDVLYDRSRVQHLALTPRNLLFDGGHLFLAEVGLVQSLGQEQPGMRQRAKARHHFPYAAPEVVLDDQPAASSDQYSLALIFAEMLTGHHPYGGLARERASRERQQWQPDLDLLPGAYRDIVRRALEYDPRRRFLSCSALVKALQTATRKLEAQDEAAPIAQVLLPPALLVSDGKFVAPESGRQRLPSPAEVVSEVVASAAGGILLQEYQQIRYLVRPGHSLHHRCAAHLPPGVMSVKLDGFYHRWQARALHTQPGHCVLHIDTPRDLWQMCLGKRVGLEVELHLSEPQFRGNTRFSEVQVEMRPVQCTPGQAKEVLQRLAPAVLESLRSFLQAVPELRTQERLDFSQDLQVAPVLGNRTIGESIPSHAKDISLGGIGLLLPEQPPSADLYISMGHGPTGHTDLALLAKVVRVKRNADGWYEIGARFAAPTGWPGQA